MVFLFCLEDLSPKELILVVTEVSLLIADGKTSEELAFLGNFFSAIGQNLSTMAGANFDEEPPCK